MRPRARRRSPRTSGCRTSCRAIEQVRRAFFRQASAPAMRYGIDFDRVLTHLWRARRAHRRLPLRSLAYIDDLVTAIACIDGCAQAWADLAEQYESFLVRRTRLRMDEGDPIVFVRRLLSELRLRVGEEESDPRQPSLHAYLGATPLRTWLCARLTGALARHRPALGVVTRPPGASRLFTGLSPVRGAETGSGQVIFEPLLRSDADVLPFAAAGGRGA